MIELRQVTKTYEARAPSAANGFARTRSAKPDPSPVEGSLTATPLVPTGGVRAGGGGSLRRRAWCIS